MDWTSNVPDTQLFLLGLTPMGRIDDLISGRIPHIKPEILLYIPHIRPVFGHMFGRVPDIQSNIRFDTGYSPGSRPNI